MHLCGMWLSGAEVDGDEGWQHDERLLSEAAEVMKEVMVEKAIVSAATTQVTIVIVN